MPAPLGEYCQSIWMVIGWWIELLSKQIPKQRAEQPNSREHCPAISAVLQNLWVRGRWQPWAVPAGSTLTPTSASLVFLGPFQVCFQAGLCPDVLRRWTKICSRNEGFVCWKEMSAASRTSGDSTLKAQAPVVESWHRVWSAIIKTNRPDPQLAQSHRNSAQ